MCLCNFGNVFFNGNVKSSINDSSYLVGPCAGTLVSPRVILSAFHCTVLPRTNLSPKSCGKRLAILGRHEIHMDSLSSYTTIPVIKVFAPPNTPLKEHDYRTHDFALLLLEHPAMYSSKVSPICLPEPNAEFGELKATAAGWGSTDSVSTEQSPVLKAVELTVSPMQYNHKKMFGTKLSRKGDQYQDACSGDSGNCTTLSQDYQFIPKSCRRSPDVLQPENLQICPDRHSVWWWV